MSSLSPFTWCITLCNLPVEPPLHLWNKDKANLILISGPSSYVLKFGFQVFENFCGYVYLGDWPIIIIIIVSSFGLASWVPFSFSPVQSIPSAIFSSPVVTGSFSLFLLGESFFLLNYTNSFAMWIAQVGQLLSFSTWIMTLHAILAFRVQEISCILMGFLHVWLGAYHF